MAIEAEGHIQRLHLLHLHHLIDSAVAADTAHADRNVRLMVEENVVRQSVTAHPLDRLTRIKAVANFSSRGLCGFTRVWQFMQTSVCGIAACPDLLAV